MTATSQRSIATGWGQVLTLSFTEVTSWGILYYIFPVFLAPMMHELHWQQTTLTGAYSLALLASGMFAIPVGRWLDRSRSPRLMMTLGSVVGMVAIGAWSIVANTIPFYLIWIGLGLAMATNLSEPAFATVTAWFQQRERPLTVLTTIGGLASVIYLPLAGLLVQQFGWRSSLVVFSIILGVCTLLPHALLLRPFPAVPQTTHEHGTFSLSPWRKWSFWQLIASFVLAQFAVSAIFVHLIPFLIDQGIPPALAATATGMIGSVSLFGRAFITLRSTTQTRAAIISAVFVVQAIGLCVLLLGHGIVAIVAFIVLFGIGFGIISPARASLIADRFGTTTFAQINGQLALAVTLARAVGPAGASFLLLFMGSYVSVFWIFAVLTMLAAVILLLPDRMPDFRMFFPHQER